jgi:hypothetical protein
MRYFCATLYYTAKHDRDLYRKGIVDKEDKQIVISSKISRKDGINNLAEEFS